MIRIGGKKGGRRRGNARSTGGQTVSIGGRQRAANPQRKKSQSVVKGKEEGFPKLRPGDKVIAQPSDGVRLVAKGSKKQKKPIRVQAGNQDDEPKTIKGRVVQEQRRTREIGGNRDVPRTAVAPSEPYNVHQLQPPVEDAEVVEDVEVSEAPPPGSYYSDRLGRFVSPGELDYNERVARLAGAV